MSHHAETVVSPTRNDQIQSVMSVLPGPCSPDVCVLHVEGALRAPIDRDLRHSVRALLRRGEKGVLLDLAGVSRIDAAGVGELVRAYNMTTAANGVLRVTHPTRWVQEILERVGLFEILTRGDCRRQ
jgi:anti-anti-sigma factor